MRRRASARPLWEALDRQRAALGWSWDGVVRMTAHHTDDGTPIAERDLKEIHLGRRMPAPATVYALADTVGMDRAAAAALAGLVTSVESADKRGVIVTDGLTGPQRDLVLALVDAMVRANR